MSFHYFSAHDVFDKIDAEQLLGVGDRHPSARGHAVLADALFGCLVESGIAKQVIGSPE